MQFFPKSLRLRVIVNVFATSLLVVLLIGSLIFSQINVVTEKLARKKLLEQAKRIASYIEYDWKGSLDLDLPRGYRDYFSSGESGQFAVLDAGGRILFRSKNFVRERIKKGISKESGKYYFDFETEDGNRFVGLKYDYLYEDKIYPIYVIEDENEFSQFITALEKDFLTNILSYGIPLLILQALIILFIFRQTFKPIIKAARDARKIKYDNLSFRLDEDVHIEIKPLIQSINNGLARLEKSAEAQRFFIANAAHELRTPISILKARISSLKDEKEVYLLNEDLRNINRLISQMLDISRLDLAESAPKSEVNLNELAKKVCQDMGALFISEEKELALEQKKRDQIILGNEDTLYRAILNLLENALKHTPEKTSVEMIVEEKKITVRDYGEPIPAEHKIKIFEKFEKLPESAGSKGSGLGLAIVKKAAEIHGGVVTLITREDGNDFILEF